MKRRTFGAVGLVCALFIQLSCVVMPVSATQDDFSPVWPLREGFDVISLDYYPKSEETKHGGIDVIGGSSKQYVYPVADGTVIELGNDCPHYSTKDNRHDNDNCPGKLNGNYVILRHNVGGKIYYSKYLHFAQNSIPSELIEKFEKGETVKVTTNDPLGKMGSSGDSVGAHLHFSIYTGTYSKTKGQKTFDYYMNDTSLVKKIRIRSGLANTSQRYGAWIKENGKVKNGYYVFTDTTQNTTQNTVTATSTVEGQWTVTVPANYKLLCYSSSTATSSSTYISAKSAAYRIACTKKATLSNGTTRYFFVSGDNKSVWFDFTSSMTVVSATPASVYTISFNATGGSVSPSSKTVTRGSTYGELPTPTRSNYTFDGWYTAQSGGGKVTSSTSVNISTNQTLYAHWSAAKQPDSTLSINLTNYPTNITKGNIFSLQGAITSNYNITSVKGYIINSSNNTILQTTTDTPNAKTMDIRPAKLNQSMLFDKLSEGTYYLRIEATDASGKTLVSSKSFTVKSGSSSSNTSNQVIANGTYVIATKLDTNYVLDISSASKDNGANLQLWESNGTPAQTFRVTHVSNGYYQIVNVNSGKAVDVQNGSAAEGSNVWQYQINNSDAQLWKIVDAGDGSYYIIGKGSGLYLDVDNANADSGTNIKIFDRNDGYDAQKWIFYKK